MTRPLRIEYPGAVYHVTSRGNERKQIFKDDKDREIFLITLHNVTLRYNWLCHAYCLMDNHYHLLIETPDGNLSLGMRQLNGVFTQRFNNRHKRAGHLFQGRFKGILIQKESHLLEVCRYVVLNPLRARIVENLAQWKWSSYLATAGREKPHPCLTTDWVLAQFSDKRRKAEKEYRQFVEDGIGNKSIWFDLKGQIILGGDDFAEGLTERLQRYNKVPDIPKSQRFVDRPALENLFNKNILKDKQMRDNRIFEAVEKHGYRQIEIAQYLDLHPSTVSNIVRGRD